MNVLWAAVVFVVLVGAEYGQGQQLWDVLQPYRSFDIKNGTVHINADDVGCKTTGLQCTSCNTLSLCLATGSGLVEFHTEYCDANVGEYCSESLKECSGRKSYCSQHARFECQDEGAFPDPFDCNQYYVCSSAPDGGFSAEKVVCPARTAFNAKTFQCDLSDDDEICRRFPVPECPANGLTSGALPENPNLYYVCRNGLPYLFKCVEGNDYIYDPDLYTCVRDEAVTTTTEDPRDCVEGSYGLIPYTCRYAVRCNIDMKPWAWIVCGSDDHYNPETGECEKGQCMTQHEWTLACPTTELQHVPKTCNLYYDCTSETEKVLSCPAYFHRETKTCTGGRCPYLTQT